jgi:hypothetical protein
MTTVGIAMSNYTTILLDPSLNQMRYVAPTHTFQESTTSVSLSNLLDPTSQTTVMTLKNGNVGIGAEDPQARLHVAGNQLVGTYTEWASYRTVNLNLLLPVSDGRINGVNITTLNQRTRASAAAAASAVSAWTGHTSSDNTVQWFSVCWSPELRIFCAVGNAGVMTSSDGITWTGQTPPNDVAWASVCWSSELGMFCAVAYAGIGSMVMTSSDGITWTGRNDAQYDVSNNSWNSVCWSRELGLFCAVGLNQARGSVIMTSEDGITWTGHIVPISSTWNSVCWSSELGLFCAVGSPGGPANRVMTSQDGITWTGHEASDDSVGWNSVCWSPELGVFCAVANDGSVMTSPDGITWTGQITPEDAVWGSVCWSPELSVFCAVANDGSVMTSRNGITWTGQNALQDGVWCAVCWSPELSIFCAVADSGGVGYDVMTSAIGMPNAFNVVKAHASQMVVDAQGNVGIGITDPQYKLQIAGSIVPSACNVYDLGTPTLRFRDLYLSGSTLDIEGTVVQKDPSTGGLRVTGESGTTVPLISDTVSLSNLTTSQPFIDVSGKTLSNIDAVYATHVGINTSSVDASLHVQGNAKISNTLGSSLTISPSSITTTTSQETRFEFANILSPVANAYPAAMTCDSAGNLYVTGSFLTSGSTVVTVHNLDGTPSTTSFNVTHAGGNGFIIKYTPGGEVAAATMLDGLSYDEGSYVYDIQLDSQGNIYVCGEALLLSTYTLKNFNGTSSTYSMGPFTDWSGFLIKYNTQGTVVGYNQYANGIVYNIAISPVNDDVFVAVRTVDALVATNLDGTGSSTMTAPPNQVSPTAYIGLVLFNASGVLQGMGYCDHPVSNDNALSMYVDSNGSLYVCPGTPYENLFLGPAAVSIKNITNSTVQTLTLPSSDSYSLVFKFDANGQYSGSCSFRGATILRVHESPSGQLILQGRVNQPPSTVVFTSFQGTSTSHSVASGQFGHLTTLDAQGDIASMAFFDKHPYTDWLRSAGMVSTPSHLYVGFACLGNQTLPNLDGTSSGISLPTMQEPDLSYVVLKYDASGLLQEYYMSNDGFTSYYNHNLLIAVNANTVFYGMTATNITNGYIYTGGSLQTFSHPLQTSNGEFTMAVFRYEAGVSIVGASIQFNSQNVGMGITVPQERLHVQGNVLVSDNVSASSFSGSGASLSNLNATLITSGTLPVARGGTGTNSLASGKVLVGNDASAVQAPINLSWDEANTRLGIGLTNPGHTLHVAGTAFVSDTITTSNLNVLGNTTVVNTFTTQSSNLLIRNDLGTGPALAIYQKTISGNGILMDVFDTDVVLSGDTKPAFRIQDGGNVGVGTATALEKLHVEGTAKATIVSAPTVRNVNVLVFGGDLS